MNKDWYAVMMDHDDIDWGTGSFDQYEAERMVCKNLDIYPDGYIAIIRGDDCIAEISQDDFSPAYYYAARIIKAHDWDEAKDDLKSLAVWLNMESEWEQADGDNFEDVIREMGKKIGVNLI